MCSSMVYTVSEMVLQLHSLLLPGSLLPLLRLCASLLKVACCTSLPACVVMLGTSGHASFGGPVVTPELGQTTKQLHQDPATNAHGT